MKKSKEPQYWRIGKYIRLSREDGNEVSESVVNQDRILTEAIPRLFAPGTFEVAETYVDDGTSGTTDRERPSFRRMARDVETGRVNCVMVKNLSRAFRNSADQGHFLAEFLPLYGARFISLYQPAVDTWLDPEAVHGLEVGVTGFLNEQYAYKTSVDVRRTFRHKMENGAFVGGFAPYGYAKDPTDRNALIVDEDAARIVRGIFSWYVNEGVSKSGIARRLNACGIPNPPAYKREKGLPYHNPKAKDGAGLWCARTVGQILKDPIYIGTMRQGRQRVVSYKIHRRTAVAEEDWITVENAVEPVVGREIFDRARRLNELAAHAAPKQNTVHPFAGLLRCASCGAAMARSMSRGRVYYACGTYRKQGKTRCAAHTVRGEDLERAVRAAFRLLLALAAPEPPAAPKACGPSDAPAERKTEELARTQRLLDGLYCDWKSGELDREQYRRLRRELTERAAALRGQLDRLAEERAAARDDAARRAALRETGDLQTPDRGLLVALLDAVRVRDDGTLELVLRFADPFRRLARGCAAGNGPVGPT